MSVPIAAVCPRCGAPLNETSVLALAPVCEHCDVVITGVGGTLGLTSAFGINDPTITRDRVIADLQVFERYLVNYRGMREYCKQKLNWGPERYAERPVPPELLPLKPVPSLWKKPLGCSGAFAVFSVIVIGGNVVMANFLGGRLPGPVSDACFSFGAITFLIFVVGLLFSSPGYLSARIANGFRPAENRRRQEAYKAACASALRAAEPIKAAQDYDLSRQIRELDGLITTVNAKADSVRKILEEHQRKR